MLFASSPSLSSTPFYKIMVPTVDTVRYDFLVHNLILSERPVLLVGPVGTGKTSVAQGVVQKLDSSEYSLLTINLSSQVGLAQGRSSGICMLCCCTNSGLVIMLIIWTEALFQYSCQNSSKVDLPE